MDLNAPATSALTLSRPQSQAPLALAKPALILGNVSKTSTPAQIDKAARDLESVFAKMLISSMRQASFGDPLFPDQNTAYRDLYDQQLAKQLSSGPGLGLAPVIKRQLSAASGTGDATSFDTGKPTPMLALTPRSNGLSDTTSAARLMLGGQRDQAAPAVRFDVNAAVLQALGTGTGPSDDARPSPLLPDDFNAVTPLPTEPLSAKASHAKPGSPEAFVASIWPQAQRAAEQLGVDPKVLVAQAALETGWGRHVLGRQKDGSGGNLFGIKAGGRWTGASATANTQEFVSGRAVRENATFRAYDSIRESFDDYVALLKGSGRYAAALNTGSDRHRFATALHQAGYATDPHYASKLVAIADGPTLRRALDQLNPAPVLAANDHNPRAALNLPNAVES